MMTIVAVIVMVIVVVLVVAIRSSGIDGTSVGDSDAIN